MNFRGVIIEESLEDKSVLGGVIVTKTDVEPVTTKHKTPWVKHWTLHAVEVPSAQAGEIAETLSRALDHTHNHAWYADFKSDNEHYIIYADKVFHITDRTDPVQYKEAKEYGMKIGIPEYQVDFAPADKIWER